MRSNINKKADSLKDDLTEDFKVNKSKKLLKVEVRHRSTGKTTRILNIDNTPLKQDLSSIIILNKDRLNPDVNNENSFHIVINWSGEFNNTEYGVYHGRKIPLFSLKRNEGCDECKSVLLYDETRRELFCSNCGLVHKYQEFNPK